MGTLLPDRGSSFRLTERHFNPETQREVELIVRTLEDHKAHDVVVLDLRLVSDATDLFIIASGTSNTHVRSLAERVLEALSSGGVKPHHVEGVEGGRWALLDLVDCIVHLFHPTLREYYQLERLWADAVPVPTESLR